MFESIIKNLNEHVPKASYKFNLAIAAAAASSMESSWQI